MATLYIVATPIGNLSELSLRAIETLKGVDLILCEDTRVTRKLLAHYQIKTPVLSYHQHSELKKVEYIIKLLKEDKNLALVSDAGTPGISDPGNKLVEKVIELLSAQVKIVPVSGPSAITAAASISGFPMDKFIFMGFPPAKKKRGKFFKEMVNSRYPVIFYESPYRILKTLKELQTTMDSEQRTTNNIVVCRELTKKFETVYRGTIEGVLKQLGKSKVKGEFVVVVEGKR